MLIYEIGYHLRDEPIEELPPKAQYPFNEMEVGHTFYVNLTADGKRPFQKLYSARAYYQKKFPDRKWTVRSVSTGLRVQRVA